MTAQTSDVDSAKRALEREASGALRHEREMGRA
jgi:hypothetical protein